MSSAEGKRLARWGERDRIDGRRFIDASLLARTFVPIPMLASAIAALLEDAHRQGADLTDLVLTVTPPTAEDAAAKLVPHITVTLQAVRA